MNIKVVLIYVYLCMFIYLFQMYSIHVYTYANVYILVIRRGTAPPPINLMFLGEHALFNCVPTDSEANRLTSAGMDMRILRRHTEINAEYFLKTGRSTQVLLLTQLMSL